MPEQAQPREPLLTRWRRRANRLRQDIAALTIAYRDPRVPLPARLLIVLVAAYAFSPIDLIPDFIPVLGYLDDLLILPLGIALAIRLIPPPVLAAARTRAAQDTAKPPAWAGALLVALLWFAFALFVWRLLRPHISR